VNLARARRGSAQIPEALGLHRSHLGGAELRGRLGRSTPRASSNELGLSHLTFLGFDGLEHGDYDIIKV